MGMRRGLSSGLVVCLALWLCLALAAPALAAPRYKVSAEGVISDGKTGLEWVVGPNKPTSYNQAKAWVRECKIAGGGWRLPTREELEALYTPGVGRYNLDPAFKVETAGSMKPGDGREVGFMFVWAESGNGPVIKNLFFSNGGEVAWNMPDLGIEGSLAFAVRPSPRK